MDTVIHYENGCNCKCNQEAEEMELINRNHHVKQYCFVQCFALILSSDNLSQKCTC
jgi:hypothetical protein